MSLPTAHDSRSSLILRSIYNLIFNKFMHQWLSWPNSHLLPVIIKIACMDIHLQKFSGNFPDTSLLIFLPLHKVLKYQYPIFMERKQYIKLSSYWNQSRTAWGPSYLLSIIVNNCAGAMTKELHSPRYIFIKAISTPFLKK